MNMAWVSLKVTEYMEKKVKVDWFAALVTSS